MTTMNIPTRHLGELAVSAQGLGCMGMSHGYGESDDVQSAATINRALDLGVSLLDTADFYGAGHNEELIGRAIAGRRDEVLLATKFGFANRLGEPTAIRGDAAYVHEACDASLRRLGVDHIDLYYQHRVDPEVPIEETVGAMAELVTALQGPPSRALRGECGDAAPGACGASDRRAAERVVAVDARSGGRDRTGVP